MPKYTFECAGCQTEFTRMLKMGEHPTHPCGICGLAAPRQWMGQGFGHSFAVPSSAAPANTGVTKNDYPTADHIVGTQAEARWNTYHERARVKEKVREVSGTQTLMRRHGEGFVEYEAGTKDLIDRRKQLQREAEARGVTGTTSTADLQAQMTRDTAPKSSQ